jgi:hypothetical protein
VVYRVKFSNTKAKEGRDPHAALKIFLPWGGVWIDAGVLLGYTSTKLKGERKFGLFGCDMYRVSGTVLY